MSSVGFLLGLSTGRVGLGLGLTCNRLDNRVNGKWTCGRLNVRVELGGMGHRLSGSNRRVISGLNPNKIKIKTE